MLHEGRFIPHQGGYTRVLFIEPGGGTLVAHNNVMHDALNIDVNIFVRDMDQDPNMTLIVWNGAQYSERKVNVPNRRLYCKLADYKVH